MADDSTPTTGTVSHLMLVKVSEVKVRTRLRASNQENIREIAESIADIGLINPISIDADLNLIAGYHRLQAHKLLSLPEIPAIISTHKELKARLQEVDENLKRAELTAIEKSVHIEEREDIFKKLNRLSIKGDNRFSAAGKSTQQDRAAEIGMSRRNHQYHKELEQLHPEAREPLAAARKLRPKESRATKDFAGYFSASIIEKTDKFMLVHKCISSLPATPTLTKEADLDYKQWLLPLILPRQVMLDLAAAADTYAECRRRSQAPNILGGRRRQTL